MEGNNSTHLKVKQVTRDSNLEDITCEVSNEVGTSRKITRLSIHCEYPCLYETLCPYVSVPVCPCELLCPPLCVCTNASVSAGNCPPFCLCSYVRLCAPLPLFSQLQITILVVHNLRISISVPPYLTTFLHCYFSS